LSISSHEPLTDSLRQIVTFGVTANLSAGSGPVAAYIRKEGFYSAFGSKAGVDVCSFDYNTTTAVPIPVVELTPTGCNTTLSYQITFRSLNSNASEIVPFSFVYSARSTHYFSILSSAIIIDLSISCHSHHVAEELHWLICTRGEEAHRLSVPVPFRHGFDELLEAHL